MEEKNLVNPRACFSGVGVDETEEDPDFVGWWFGYFEPTGDLSKLLASESDGLKAALNRFMGDSEPALCVWKVVAVSTSGASKSCKFMPLIVGNSSSSEVSTF